MQSGEDNATDALTAQLNILSKQEEALQRGLERTEAGGNNDDKTGEGNGEAGDGGVVPAGSHGNTTTPYSQFVPSNQDTTSANPILKTNAQSLTLSLPLPLPHRKQ